MTSPPPAGDLTIRRPARADAQAWASFVAVEQARAYAELIPRPFADRIRAEVDGVATSLAEEFDAPSGHRRALAEADGEIVGIAAAGPAPAPWEVELGLVPPPAPVELHRLYLRPDRQGTGLADRLLAEVLDDGPAYLWLIAGNIRAERFYRRRGFRSLDERVPAGESWLFAPMHRMVRAGAPAQQMAARPGPAR